MSAFRSKIKELKEKTIVKPVDSDQLATVHRNTNRNACSATELHLSACSKSPRTNLMIPEPVLVLKKKEKQTSVYGLLQPKRIKKAEHFVPLDIPKSPPSGQRSARKIALDRQSKTQSSTPCLKRQIQIHIDKDEDKNKACLKKLFKKIHTLSLDLAESQKQRVRLQLQLNNFKEVDGFNRGQQKELAKLEGEQYKSKSQIELLKNQLRDKAKQLVEAKNKTPNQIIKQVVIEKPIQVRVEVPKYVQGPERIIQVPKYIESQSMKDQILSLRRKIATLQEEVKREKEVNKKRELEMAIPAIVEKPIYLEKPVYVDRPVYIDKPYQVIKQKVVQVPIEVPYEVPVYIDKPHLDQQIINKINELESSAQVFFRENQQLKIQNDYLRTLLVAVQSNLQILKRHNFSKNNEIQSLLNNMEDYNPIKAKDIVHKEVKRVRKEKNTVNFEQQTFNPTKR